MEVIQLSGYTVDEKLHIAKRYLVPRQLEANGLKAAQVEFADAALQGDHRGVHPRGRRPQPRARDRHGLPQGRPRRSPRARRKGKVNGLGQARPRAARQRRVFSEPRRRTKVPGVATGLAWTPVGGEVLFIEATAMPGTGKLTITGQLGDVMRESAQAALSYVRGHLRARSRPSSTTTGSPSTTSTSTSPPAPSPRTGRRPASRWRPRSPRWSRGRPVRNDVAMTGEITLTGQVLPVGGLKEKSLAAQRAGIKRVIVPARNEGDIAEIPEHELGGLEFVYVDDIGEALRGGARLDASASAG